MRKCGLCFHHRSSFGGNRTIAGSISYIRSPMKTLHLMQSWGKIFRGKSPLLSIEITRECPLSCPGCYAYGESHLGGETTLTRCFRFSRRPTGQRNPRADRKARSGSSVSGRRRTVDSPSRVEPRASGVERARHIRDGGDQRRDSDSGSGRICRASRWPCRWTACPEHDVRRRPATYDRILRNIAGRRVNIHCTIVRAHLEQAGYLEQFLAFWSARPEVNRIWFSVYTPQRGESTPEMLRPEQRVRACRRTSRHGAPLPEADASRRYGARLRRAS